VGVDATGIGTRDATTAPASRPKNPRREIIGQILSTPNRHVELAVQGPRALDG